MLGFVEMVGNSEARLKRIMRASLAETRFGNLQVLVAGGRLLFERSELRIAERLPPFRRKRRCAGLSEFPVFRFLEAVRRRFLETAGHGRGRSRILWTNRAAGDQQGGYNREDPSLVIGRFSSRTSLLHANRRIRSPANPKDRG